MSVEQEDATDTGLAVLRACGAVARCIAMRTRHRGKRQGGVRTEGRIHVHQFFVPRYRPKWNPADEVLSTSKCCLHWRYLRHHACAVGDQLPLWRIRRDLPITYPHGLFASQPPAGIVPELPQAAGFGALAVITVT